MRICVTITITGLTVAACLITLLRLALRTAPVRAATAVTARFGVPAVTPLTIPLVPGVLWAAAFPRTAREPRLIIRAWTRSRHRPPQHLIDAALTRHPAAAANPR